MKRGKMSDLLSFAWSFIVCSPLFFLFYQKHLCYLGQYRLHHWSLPCISLPSKYRCFFFWFFCKMRLIYEGRLDCRPSCCFSPSRIHLVSYSSLPTSNAVFLPVEVISASASRRSSNIQKRAWSTFNRSNYSSLLTLIFERCHIETIELNSTKSSKSSNSWLWQIQTSQQNRASKALSSKHLLYLSSSSHFSPSFFRTLSE